MTGWFGTHWGAPICVEAPQLAVPVGETCAHCEEPIAATDSGLVLPSVESFGNALVTAVVQYHLECHCRLILGSTGHQLRLCSCYGGSYEGEPEGMSRRDAARAAYELAQALYRRAREEDAS